MLDTELNNDDPLGGSDIQDENDDDDDSTSDLNEIRQRNMKALEEARAALKSVADEFNSQLREDNEKALKARRHSMAAGAQKRPRSPILDRKSTRLTGMPIVDYRGLEFDEDLRGNRRYRNPDDNLNNLLSKLKPGAVKRRHSISTIRSLPVTVLNVEDVTEEMISKINYMSTKKKYDPVNGKSCHQCRQKTADTKSVCRSGFCFGVRGQFCGACLKDHYGQDLAEALRDPVWQCPMCRGVCNCSFCRKKAGRAPLGQISSYVRTLGYKSVHHFLMEKEGPGAPADHESEDEENEEKEELVFPVKEAKKMPDKIGSTRPSNLLTVKIPFGMFNKRAKTSKSEKSKKAPLRTKEEMEKVCESFSACKDTPDPPNPQLIVSIGAEVPVSEQKLLELKQKISEELEEEWISALKEPGDEPFHGFKDTTMQEDLVALSKIESRLQKYKVNELLADHKFNDFFQKSSDPCDGL
ncbi:Hypothetical predicted protein [Cloeon dipterum]|uniref:Zinc-finger domain-containing protein n=1 Tax=Cloeon dipterum TaxID=197152 RepID=A0A8S1DMY4_9INSE|nr:Hypothetical predicted protein [Cloeon dipterum]